MKRLFAGLTVLALVLFASGPTDARGGMGGGMGVHGGMGGMGFAGPRMGGMGFAGPRAYGFAPGLRMGPRFAPGLQRSFVRPFPFRRRFFPGFGFAAAAPFAFGGWGGGWGGGSICQNLLTGQIFAC